MSNDYNNYPQQGYGSYGQPSYGQPYQPQPPTSYNDPNQPAGAYPPPAGYPTPMPVPYPNQVYAPPVAPSGSGDGLAIAGLVLGICSLALFWCYGIVGLLLGIIGIILSVQGRHSVRHRTMATVGLWLSVGGLVLSLFVGGFEWWAIIYAGTHPSPYSY